MTAGAATSRLVVLPAEEGMRLDQFLAAATGLSRRAARSLIDRGGVARDGSPTRVQARSVVAGTVVDVLLPPGQSIPHHRPAITPPRILHEDRSLLVADKPAGALSQPDERRDPSELAFDQVLLLHLALRDGRRPFLRLLHRLDRLTSGAFLCARTPEALPPLVRAWAAGEVDRRYLAVVEGCPSFTESEVDLGIARDPDHVWRFVVSDRGRPARTALRVLDRGDELSVIECRLLTGRTHQVRVHLAAIGHPVAGDRLYGSSRRTAPARPLLHAFELELPHPETGHRLRVRSPLPEDLRSELGRQRLTQILATLESRLAPDAASRAHGL